MDHDRIMQDTSAAAVSAMCSVSNACSLSLSLSLSLCCGLAWYEAISQ